LSENELVHVAVGLIVNTDDEVLVALRHPQSHQGGLWEFPGGKVEPGESVFAALDREFREELGVSVQRAFPMRQIIHAYPDKRVLLDVWRITEFSGQATGREGQQLKWQAVSALQAQHFPRANSPIIQLLRLPDRIAITPTLHSSVELERFIERCARRSVRCLQLRQKQLSAGDYDAWFQLASAACNEAGISLIANIPIARSPAYAGCPVHYSAADLMQATAEPDSVHPLKSASCHNLAELRKAAELDMDFVYLSPVAATEKYSPQQLLGWADFEELAGRVSIPVYALGGMCLDDLERAKAHGAVGIAGIGMFDTSA
jgi:8-oxo-dGTP diphosphatase